MNNSVNHIKLVGNQLILESNPYMEQLEANRPP